MNIKKLLSLIVLLFSVCFSGTSNAQLTEEQIKNSNVNCWYRSSLKYGLDPWLLYSVAYVESRHNMFAVNKNRNGSYDLGMMQINSIWLPELKRHGIEPKHLFDACTSIDVGAWILAKSIRRYGYNVRGVGAYNSARPEIGNKYAAKVLKAYSGFTGTRNLSVRNNVGASKSLVDPNISGNK